MVQGIKDTRIPEDALEHLLLLATQLLEVFAEHHSSEFTHCLVQLLKFSFAFEGLLDHVSVTLDGLQLTFELFDLVKKLDVFVFADAKVNLSLLMLLLDRGHL